MGRFSLNRKAEAPAPAPEPPKTAVAPPPEPKAEPRAAKPAPPPPKSPQAQQIELRMKLHARLIDELDLSKLEKLEEHELRRQVLNLVADFARAERLALNTAEVEELGASIYDEMVGLGPIEPLLKDETISDILINGPYQVYVERRGELELSPVHFRDNDHLLRIINRIVAAVGRRIDESQPMVDARLADGSRVNAAIPPIAIDGGDLRRHRLG
jgi:pilus assembly protein CpaF